MPRTPDEFPELVGVVWQKTRQQTLHEAPEMFDGVEVERITRPIKNIDVASSEKCASGDGVVGLGVIL